MKTRFLGSAALLALALMFSLASATATAANRARVATDATGSRVKVDGSIVVIEPDLEL